MIGTGPFVFGNYTPDVELSFRRNQDWFEKDRPYLDGLHLAIIPDPAQRLAQFKAGNLDQITLASTDVDSMKSANPKADLVASSPSQMWPLVGSLADPSSPWNDIRVRRAFSMALDRVAIGASVLGGKYQKQAVLPLSLGKWAVKPQDLDSTLSGPGLYVRSGDGETAACGGGSLEPLTEVHVCAERLRAAISHPRAKRSAAC